MYRCRMKMNRFSSGMPALHSPFIPSSWMKFTTSANVRRSTCDCDSLRVVHAPNPRHRALHNRLLLRRVRAEAPPVRVRDSQNHHAHHEVHPLRPTTVVDLPGSMSGKYSFSERSTFSSMI